ncbi:MAG: hypothetical protein GXP62_16320 [Oligoflexia bacterium]|nr:hypothetical protein [Oligoflexia bacterium]
MLVALALALALSAQAAAPLPDPSPTDVAQTHMSFGAYGADGYVGMALLDGTPLAGGGATLVVRYFVAGQADAAWLEGATVDTRGKLVSVVHRQGRRFRTLTLTDDGVKDVVTEGTDSAPLSSQSHTVQGALNSPWLVAMSLAASIPADGCAWEGALVDGLVRSVSPATLACSGKHDVGQGRTALVARLQPQAGLARTFLYDQDGLSAIIQPQDGIQWVAMQRELIQRIQDGTLP